MGDMADDMYMKMMHEEAAYEAAIEQADILWKRMYVNPDRFRNIIEWKSKDGRKIKLSKMTDSHLANTIAMLERNDNPTAWIEILKLEQELRKPQL